MGLFHKSLDLIVIMGKSQFQNNIGANGWYYSLEANKKQSNFPSGKMSFDYVVVGAGFVGVAAVRRLAELSPESDIALIDATKVGLGTSGRCSGFIIDTPHKGDLIHDDSNLHKQAFKINRKAIQWLEGIVKEDKIDCDWNRAGKYQVAASQRGENFLEVYKRMLENADEEYKFLSKDELSMTMGTDYYKSGIFTPNCILIQPAAYLLGIVSALPKNVTVFEETLVEDLVEGVKGMTLQVNGATIDCKKVVLSVNIFAREFGFFKNRMVPIITYASMSKKLTEEQQEQYKGTYDWGLTSADKGGTTMRMTRDKRLVIRNHYTHTPGYKVKDSFINKMSDRHQQGIIDRYPHIEDLEIEYSWGGVCSLSRNFGFFAGELKKNVFSALCHNGVGAARGSIAGKAVAEKMVLGTSDDLELLSKVSIPCWNPPEPFLSIGISTRLAYERWKSKPEL